MAQKKQCILYPYCVVALLLDSRSSHLYVMYLLCTDQGIAEEKV
jgi:hypothetical protein